MILGLYFKEEIKVPPLRDYICDSCGHQFESVVFSNSPEDYKTAQCRCGEQAELLPPLIGGYNGDTGSSSSRPKNSTSMPKVKVYTGKKHGTS